MSGDDLRIEIADQTFLLTADRLAFWEEEKILFGSDFHWGREAFLQRRGFPVPEGVFREEIAILDRLIHRYRPSRLFVLGDLIHHPAGMHEGLKRSIREWTNSHSGVEVSLIPGNHDRALSSWLPECGIQLAGEEVISSGIRFRHEPSPRKEEAKVFTWYGHLHPSARIQELGNEKFPAFLVRPNEAFLPAFSLLAGGNEVKKGSRDRFFPTGEGVIFEWKSGTF